MNDTFEFSDTKTVGKPARRLPILAAIMSAALPGFGQLYNGQVNKAIWIFILFSLMVIPVPAVIALFLPPAFTVVMIGLSLLITIAVWLYGIIDAWRAARDLSAYSLKPWQTTGAYVLVFILCNLIVLPLVLRYVQKNLVQAYSIPSASMSPTVQRGDYIFANKSYNCAVLCRSVKHGDVALFVYPNNRNWTYIKRIIGMPGDLVTAKDGVVSINGTSLGKPANNASNTIVESYKGRSWSVSAEGVIPDFSETVQDGFVFVMGDNRTKSKDSRVFGQVPLADVVGRARQVWFSFDDNGINWGRLGTDLTPELVEN